MSNRLQELLKSVADNTIIRMVNFVVFRVRAGHQNVIERVIERALIDSAEYAETHMQEAVYFRSKEDLWDFAVSKIEFDGGVAEFGVFKGYSINYFARKLGSNATIYGFDSFEGLQEDWRGHVLKTGDFSLGGRLPKVARNVKLIKGWFDQTVPDFLAKHPGNFSFIHIDSDTYEAARSVLKLIGPKLQKGTVVLFDEYFGFRGWRLGEWKAWKEFVESTGVQYEYLGFAKEQVAIKIGKGMEL
jgi:predicted O-methyltransferase YrrM